MGLSWTGFGGSAADLAAPSLTCNYNACSCLNNINVVDTTGQQVSASVSRTAATRSNSIYPQAGQSQYTTYYPDTAGRTSSTSSTYESNGLRWDRDRLAARGSILTADRWEYRYNAKGEVAQGWKQFGSTVTATGGGPAVTG